MDENRFFKFVWRFNGIIIMVALVLALGVVCYNIGKELFGSRAPQVIKNVAEDPSGQEKWRLGYPQQIEGTNYIYIPANLIAFSMPDGSRYKEVISGADRLIDVMLADNKSAFIMYQTQGVGYSATLRLRDMSTIGKSELPKVPN